MKSRSRILSLGVSVVLLTNAVADAAVSQLWGNAGEAWTPASRLPDFSRASYHSAEDAIPDKAVKANVRDYGALGDGVKDDSQAFLQAIAAVSDGAVLIPAGRYKITKQLVLKNKVVLRGAGRDQTTLYFPNSLTQAVGSAGSNAPAGSWSWSGGFIAAEGGNSSSVVATAGAAKRGDSVLALSTVSGISVGQWLRLALYDTDGSLERHLLAEQASAASDRPKLVDFAFKVKSISGTSITLDRPLRTDVRTVWTPKIFRDQPTASEIGVEDFTMEFPVLKYAGHHEEPGYNAIDFGTVAHGWIRRLRITNADSGIIIREGSEFCTIQSIEFTAPSAARLRMGYGADQGEPQNIQVGGHHGVLITGLSHDNWVTDIQFQFRFVHDISVEAYAAGNVYSAITAVDISVDHHRRAPFENLFTAIDGGQGSRFWQDSGDESDGPPGGARETFWNVRTATAQRLPSWALQMNMIGLTTTAANLISTTGNWIEAIAPAQLTPPDLYLAQRANPPVTPPPPPPQPPPPPPPAVSDCDMNSDGQTNVVDVQLEVNQALGKTACSGDVNNDSVCNIVDVQRVVNAISAGVCVTN